MNAKALAIAFLAAVFYIGSATFPETVKSVGRLFAADRPGILEAKDTIDDAYRGMLDFEHANFKDKGSYINLNGLMARLMGQRRMNKTTKLDNGYLTRPAGKRKTTKSVVQMTRLFKEQNERGKAFLFVLAPYKVPKYEDLLPAGSKESGNRSADAFLAALEENNVPVLDLRDEMLKDGITCSAAFFKTDHHWKPETGFWAYTKIIEHLTQMGLIDPVDPMYTVLNGYNIDVYRDFFLGSYGKRTGRYFAGIDDFSVITPRFDTSLSIEIPSKGISLEGEFAEIAFDNKAIRKDFFSANPYEAYGHGNKGFICYRNKTAPIDLRALVIGDSFSNVPFTFLPLVFTTCSQFDMRYYDGGFSEYYSGYDPDIVIVLVNVNEINSTNLTYEFISDQRSASTAPGGSDSADEEEGG